MEVGLFCFLLSAILPYRTPLVKNQAAAEIGAAMSAMLPTAANTPLVKNQAAANGLPTAAEVWKNIHILIFIEIYIIWRNNNIIMFC
jgi:hypothetical protein